MIDLGPAPIAIEARAAISEGAWYRSVATTGTGEGGAVFGRAAEEYDVSGRILSRLNEPLFQKLRSFLRLESGWDSYGARTVSPRALETALAFLAHMAGRPRPSIVPTVRGGIQFEWHNGPIDVELECLPSGHAQLAAEDSVSGESVERWVMPGHIAVEEWLNRMNAVAAHAAQ